MAKRALLIGCNYPGTNCHLFGCANDAFLAKSMLQECFGFREEDCKVMVDNDDTYTQPTAKNIRAEIKQLVESSKSGDTLFVHFSGHGLRLAADKDNVDETDGYDEAIVPTDMNIMVDDDLRDIMKGLPDGVAFTMVADCCHSGGMLDHREVQDFNKDDGGQWSMFDVSSFLGMVGLKEWASSASTKNRSLPMDAFLKNLTDKVGHTVEPGNIRATLASVFGGDASSKVQSFLMGTGGGKGDKQAGCLAFLKSLLGGNKKKNETAKPAAPPSPGAKPPVEQQVPPEKGVLITGCKSSEQSADADPPKGTKNPKPYGAMTKALTSVVHAHYKVNPDVPIANRTLVRMVRESLLDAGFRQHPCLEGSTKNADSGFVTHEPVPVKTST